MSGSLCADAFPIIPDGAFQPNASFLGSCLPEKCNCAKHRTLYLGPGSPMTVNEMLFTGFFV